MKKTAALLLTAILTCLVITACTTDKGTNGGDDDTTLYPWDLLPADNSVGTWVKGDTTNYKVWHDADHPDKYLCDFINGGDGRYLPFGFIRGTIINYTDGSNSATMSLFEFPNADSAQALYADLGLGITTTPITGLGDAARLDEAGLFTSSIDAINDKYYVDIDAPKASMADAESLVAEAFKNIDDYLN